MARMSHLAQPLGPQSSVYREIASFIEGPSLGSMFLPCAARTIHEDQDVCVYTSSGPSTSAPSPRHISSTSNTCMMSGLFTGFML